MKTRFLGLSGVILAALVGACEPRTASFERQDAAVYAVVLDTLFGAGPSPVRRIVLNDSTTRYLREEVEPTFFTNIDSIALDSTLGRDFERVTRARHSLRTQTSTLGSTIKTPLTYASDSVFGQMTRAADSLHHALPDLFPTFATAFAQTFRDRFGDAQAWVSVSAVGYSQHGAVSIVYVEHHCGALCGGGAIVLLQRTPTGWSVRDIHGTWAA